IVYITSSGRVAELDTTGKEVRVITDNHNGAAYWASVEVLPGGHYLIGLAGANKVIEIDGAAKVAWQCSANTPAYATRLRNGPSLVACVDNRLVMEFDRAGTEVWRQPSGGRTFRAYRR